VIKVTIWMNMPSFYQDELFESLAASGQVDLEVIFANGLDHDRKQLGWTEVSGNYSQRTLNGPTSIPEAMRLAFQQRNRIHIVNGIWAEPAFAAALTVLAAARSTFAIMTEPPDPSVQRSRLKRTLRVTFGKWISQRKEAHLLPISKRAKRDFLKLGFRAAAAYPWIYARSTPTIEVPHPDLNQSHIEVIFVGQLIHRKGIDILLRAIAPLLLENPSVRLVLVGDGEARFELSQLAEKLHVRDRVHFAGVLPSDHIQDRIAMADVLVLPSRWDGWGLVVNEALSVGTPVIVSSACGAADIVHQGQNGFVFESENEGDLYAMLRLFLQNATDARMRECARITGRAVSVEAVTPYLIACLRHMSGGATSVPEPTWLRGNALDA
jgi:glycosyltransferase involved in cell wall biosynthesis